MGIRDAIAALRGTTPQLGDITFTNAQVSRVLGLSVEQLWRTQPYLRTVVTFLARNIAQLGLHSFELVSETDRRRLRDDPLVRLLKRPNPNMTTFELIYALVADIALYDEAMWLVGPDAESDSGWAIYPVSPSWVTRKGGGSVFAPAWIEFQGPGQLRPTQVFMTDILWFHGWNPGEPSTASSPVESLKQILAEQIYAQGYRQQIWQRGGRVGTVLTRPAGNRWDAKTREKFQRQWQAKYAGMDGALAGGTPILEDGMDLKRVGFSAQEDEYVSSAKLSQAVVASVYHVNPTMIGVLDNANYSNVREFRKGLYGDTLGPLLAMIEDRINTFLVPRITTAAGVYVEFNIMEKLQGNFEEQAAAMMSAVGRPWMTADEARSKQNMPSLGGDAERLVTPLNVIVDVGASVGVEAADVGISAEDLVLLVNAAASLIRSGFDPAEALIAMGLDPIKHLGLLPVTVQKPVDGEGNVDQDLVDELTPKSGRLHTMKLLQAKARASQAEEDKAAQVLRAFFKRQGDVVLSKLGAKAVSDWWDAARWNKELADDLLKLAAASTATVGANVAKSLGFTADDYDVDQTLKFLKAVAVSRAGAINATTRDRVKASLASDDEDASPVHVFKEAADTRAGVAAATLITTFSAFATTEAAKQVAGDNARKTWLVFSGNPRSEHAQMDGETVGINEPFSNGANWPGDPVLGAEGVANCQCGVEVSIG